MVPDNGAEVASEANPVGGVDTDGYLYLGSVKNLDAGTFSRLRRIRKRYAEYLSYRLIHGRIS